MATYRVRWEIDVDADSHIDAALEALTIQRDKDSTAVVFDVTRSGNRYVQPIRIDLQSGEPKAFYQGVRK